MHLIYLKVETYPNVPRCKRSTVIEVFTKLTHNTQTLDYFETMKSF